MPWARAAAEDGTFRSREELAAIYQDEKGLSPQDDVIAFQGTPAELRALAARITAVATAASARLDITAEAG